MNAAEFQRLLHIGADSSGEDGVNVREVVEIFAVQLNLFGRIRIHRFFVCVNMLRTKPLTMTTPCAATVTMAVSSAVMSPFMIVIMGMVVRAKFLKGFVFKNRKPWCPPYTNKYFQTFIMYRYGNFHNGLLFDKHYYYNCILT